MNKKKEVNHFGLPFFLFVAVTIRLIKHSELMQITRVVTSCKSWLAANSNKLDGVSLEKGKLSLVRLEKDVPEKAKNFSASLYQMLPRITLTNLLMDVAHMTGFHDQFTHASNNRKPDKEETIIIMAAL